MEDIADIGLPLVIKRRMEVNKVEEILTKLRPSNPSEKDETELMVQIIKWLTYDETRLSQFGHLIKYFEAENIDISVMINTFRSTPSLSENGDTHLFYVNALTERFGLSYTLRQVFLRVIR